MSIVRGVIENIRESSILESNSQILKYAEVPGEESTSILRGMVDRELGIVGNSLPLFKSGEVKSGSEAAKKYNEIIKSGKFKKEIDLIFNLKTDGIGKGEILLAYLFEDMSIGDGSSNYDVTFGKEKIEVKEIKYSGGYGRNFRFGVDANEILTNTFRKLVKLWDLARHYVPELNTPEFKENVLKKGGMALTYIKDFDPKHVKKLKEIELKISDKGYVEYEGEVIASIEDSNFKEKIKSLFNVKGGIPSFEMIEKEMSEKLYQKSKESGMAYYFFDGQKSKSRKNPTYELFYKKTFPKEMKIERVTQNKVFVMVKL